MHKWNETLPWIHNLNLTPPPFRQNIWLKLNNSTKKRIKAVYHNILQIVVSSPLTTSNSPIVPFLHRSDVLWKIAFMFESIMLFPFPKDSEDTTAIIINKRIHLFRTGNLKQLYKESREVISRTPLEKANRAEAQTTSTRNKSAQLAADNDNYRSAIDRIVSDTPIAINTPEVVEILKELYPSRHKLQEEYKDTTIKKFTTAYKPLNLHAFTKLFSTLTQAKAAGPFGDITDTLKALVTHTEYPQNKQIYAKTVFDFFTLINTNKMPASIKKLYNGSFLFGLHKDIFDKKN